MPDDPTEGLGQDAVKGDVFEPAPILRGDALVDVVCQYDDSGEGEKRTGGSNFEVERLKGDRATTTGRSANVAPGNVAPEE